jgi:hypothetical protein
MKAKLKSALISNVDPFFFALCCVMLLCVSFTAKTLADDMLVGVSAATDNMMMTAEGQLLAMAQ